MRLRETESEIAFRQQARSFLAEAVEAQGPMPEGDAGQARAYNARWQRRLYDGGYAGLHWPEEYGGRGASLTDQLIFYEESARAAAPHGGSCFVGLMHGGPTLIVEGTPEQKAAHLQQILTGEQMWCQCFSEPGAGSDLAGLRTTAFRDGDHYVVNGHKIWTSYASVADYAELLARTDPDASKHGGISWLIMPMNLDGIEVRPIRTLHGGLEFCEVFLTNVRVPVENLVGAQNDGWRVTNVTLRFERGTAFAAQIVAMQRMLDGMLRTARSGARRGAPAWEDRGVRVQLGRMQAELDALQWMLKLSISEAETTGVPGLGGSAIKLMHSELYQRAAEFGLELAGRAGLSRRDVGGVESQSLAMSMLGSLQSTIAAGTSQIQRNIVGERILGQPKDR